MGSTIVDLVNDLEGKLKSRFITLQQRRLIEGMISEARLGEFHDFANEKYAAPKMELHRQLLIANLGDLAKKVVAGDYDDESPKDKIK